MKKLILIIGLLAVIFLLAVGYDYYVQWKGEKRVEELAKELERIGKEDLARKTADTLGGSTPQETLKMFIGAVEAGDYELASKYFVIEKQEEWKKELYEIADSQKIEIFLNPLKEAKKLEGEYSENKDSYSIHKPVLISFILYPSGNWKIEEI